MRIKENIRIPLKPDECWSMDFMSDSLYDGRRFRILSIAEIIAVNYCPWKLIQVSALQE